MVAGVEVKWVSLDSWVHLGLFLYCRILPSLDELLAGVVEGE